MEFKQLEVVVLKEALSLSICLSLHNLLWFVDHISYILHVQLLLNYLQAHLRKCSMDSETEEGKFAQFCQLTMSRTIENKNRKYPPSRQEVSAIEGVKVCNSMRFM